MSNQSPPPRPPAGLPAGSFRRTPPGGSNANRIPVILGGNEKLIAEAVVAANTRGLAVMFSPTSDGGALGVHAWYGKNHWKDYCTTAEELEEVLEGLRAFQPSQPAPSPLKPANAAVRRS